MSLPARTGLARQLRVAAALAPLVLPALAAGSAPGAVQALPARAAASAAASGVEVSAALEALDARTLRVTLRLTGVRAPQGASISYSLSGPGQILSQDSTDLPPGASALRELRVRIEPGQASYLNVFTRQRGRAGVVAIPLEAEPQQMKPGAGRSPGGAAQGPGLAVLPGRLR